MRLQGTPELAREFGSDVGKANFSSMWILFQFFVTAKRLQ